MSGRAPGTREACSSLVQQVARRTLPVPRKLIAVAAHVARVQPARPRLRREPSGRSFVATPTRFAAAAGVASRVTLYSEDGDRAGASVQPRMSVRKRLLGIPREVR
eukprot:scaffold1139_cov202-Prasinococcus_capsulatus_cf.AAC.1